MRTERTTRLTNEEQIEDTTRHVRVGQTSNNHVAESTRRQEEEPDEQEDRDAALVNSVGVLGIAVETDGVVPADEAEDSHKLETIISA